MAQAQQPKPPLEVLQASINSVLIETGKALRAAGINGGKTMAGPAIKLHSSIPFITNNYHQALDELEAEIVRAKSVLGRDLEELRSKRIATENPPVQIIEEPAAPEPVPPPHIEYHEDIPVATRQEGTEEITPLPIMPREVETPVKNNMSKEIVQEEKIEELRILSPPRTNESKPQAIGLGADTTLPASTDAPAASTAGGQIDSLFNVPDSAANVNSSTPNLDKMDFTMPDASTNTQSQGSNQAQNNQFDFSTFGSNPENFNINNLQHSNEASANNANITIRNNNIINKNKNNNNNNNNNNNSNNNNMDLDLDLDNMVGAEESVFDELFFDGDDDGNAVGEIGEMEHGQFDNAFFGID